MAITLAYPTVASPTALVTLDDVENLPMSRPYRVHQTAWDTDGGEQIVYDWGSQSRTFAVNLWPLDSTDAAAVESFFRLAEGAGGVNGRAGEWQFRDSLGITYDVRFAMDVLESVRQTNAWYRISLVLRVR